MGEIVSTPSLLVIKWWHVVTASSLALSDTEKVRKEKIPENGPDSPPNQSCGIGVAHQWITLKMLLDVVTYTPLISARWWQRQVDLREFEATLLYMGSPQIARTI